GGMGILWFLALALGYWAVERVGRDLGEHDHSAVVWDEVVAFWGVLLLVPASFATQSVSFLLFRFFDIVKPPPIRRIDREWQGPAGALADDLLAAGYTVLAIAFWVRFT